MKFVQNLLYDSKAAITSQLLTKPQCSHLHGHIAAFSCKTEEDIHIHSTGDILEKII